MERRARRVRRRAVRRSVIFLRFPRVEGGTLVAGFSGWADAGRISSFCLNYLVRKLGAEEFAEVVSDEFYVLSDVVKRPRVVIKGAYLEDFNYPTLRFYSCEGASPALALSFGPEPDLKWDEFLDLFSGVIERVGVEKVYTVGGVVSGERGVSVVVNDEGLKEEFKGRGVDLVTYQGPSSIHSAILSYLREKGVVAATLWGSTPYAEDPVVWLEVVRKVASVLGLELDVGDLEEMARSFERRRREREGGYEQPYIA
ncbi:MAG: putative ATP-dependent carboligase [Candidatus Alkanophagales archaeon MCA70_species_1]|nr:putative ATP-dependent carboligase [Candidatus Alkanophaga volatiphilum]